MSNNNNVNANIDACNASSHAPIDDVLRNFSQLNVSEPKLSPQVIEQVQLMLLRTLDDVFRTKADAYIKDAIERRVDLLMEQKIDEKLDALSKSVKAIEDKIEVQNQQIQETVEKEKETNKGLGQLQINFDARMAKEIEEKENRIGKIEKSCEDLQKQNKTTLDTCAQLKRQNDSTEQQGRKETIEFCNIPQADNENTTDIVVDFCNKHLNLRINRYHISVSHRQANPFEQEKYGENYIPPIYCKFMSRNLARECLNRRNKIKLLNDRNQRIFLRENLTQNRRMLFERAQNELHSYAFKWVKNGKVFVKQSNSSRVIKILTEESLQNLIERQSNSRHDTLKNSRETRNIERRRPSSSRDFYNSSHQHRPNFFHRRPLPPGHRRPMPLLSDFLPPHLAHSYNFNRNSYPQYNTSSFKSTVSSQRF